MGKSYKINFVLTKDKFVDIVLLQFGINSSVGFILTTKEFITKLIFLRLNLFDRIAS